MARPIEVVEREVKALGGPGPIKISPIWSQSDTEAYQPGIDLFFQRAPTIHATKRKLLERLKLFETRLDFLFTHPIKFKFYKKQLEAEPLEILYLSLHQGPIEIKKLSVEKRKQLFKRLIRELRARKLTFEEVRQLRIALGYPAKKPTKFQRHVREAVQQLIIDLKKAMRHTR